MNQQCVDCGKVSELLTLGGDELCRACNLKRCAASSANFANAIPCWLMHDTVRKISNHKSNQNRRIKHAVYRDLGMKRVRGALGGIYYE